MDRHALDLAALVQAPVATHLEDDSSMRKNINTLDRRLRALLIAPVAVVIGILVGPGSLGSILLYALAAVMLTTGALGYCPLCSVFGLGAHRQQPAH